MPLVGTTSTAHLDENLATLAMTIPREALTAVDTIFPIGAASGPRYPREAQAQVDTETWPDAELA